MNGFLIGYLVSVGFVASVYLMFTVNDIIKRKNLGLRELSRKERIFIYIALPVFILLPVVNLLHCLWFLSYELRVKVLVWKIRKGVV